MVNNPFLILILGDFNAKSILWCNNDITTYEGSKIDGVTSQFVWVTTHFIGDYSLCVDLIFTTQPNLLMESGVHSLLHPNCHHCNVFAKFNLKIHYPRPYEREVWHYQKATVDQIRQAISEFPSDKRLAKST